MTDQPSSPPPAFTLLRDPFGQLVLIRGAQRHPGVVPLRAFPITDPGRWVSICDRDGHEILSLENLAEVPPETRKILEEELAVGEFIPMIRRIRWATHEEPSRWLVETDRGTTAFQLDSEDDVRRIEPHRVSIVDSHGVRYLIPDARRLDGASRRLLEHFL
ncbi:MAG: DUF1854 domain-containing protein [Thermoguttaceae bacterium]|jgi:hypothetical protein